MTDSQPKKIPFAERSTRMTALRNRLAGVSITGELEPAHVLLEKACSLFDQNLVKYLEPAICISRAYEVQGTKQARELSLEKGTLVLKNQDEKLSSPTDSELKLHFAMTHRGISFEFARVMSYSQHCQWETFLVEALHRESPPGYTKPSLAQIIQCDKAAWSRLASTVESVRQRVDGSYPLGEALLALRGDPNIALFLKGKSKGTGGSPPMPKQLIGKWHKTPQGEPICFAFNTADGCQHSPGVAAGDRCPRGWHLCMEPRCQGKHGLTEHKN